jgi:hypothetical protein
MPNLTMARKLAICALLLGSAFGATVLADDGEAVCPLSHSQALKAIDAFGQLLPIFHDPRCINCHGALSPFGKGRGEHPEFGFKIVCFPNSPCATEADEDRSLTFRPCERCHSVISGGEPPRWRLAPRDMQWVVKGTQLPKPSLDLCRQLKRLFANDGDRFLRHMQNDEGKTQFLDAAYAGLRALNQEGLESATFDKNHPEPPAMPRRELESHSNEWYAAMGNAFPNPEECGCVEMHYALRLVFKGTFTAGAHVHFDFGTVDDPRRTVPIEFNDDGTVSGAGTMAGTGHGTVQLPAFGDCNATRTDTISVTVSGRWPALAKAGSADPSAGNSTSKIDLKIDTSELLGHGKAVCTLTERESNLRGPDKDSFKLSIDPVVGSSGSAIWRPAAGFFGTLTATLVRVQ